MDLRDLVRNSKKDALGHEPTNDRLNVKNEIKKYCNRDPLYDIAQQLNIEKEIIMMNDINRYHESFDSYAACLERVLRHCSIERRWESEIRYHPRKIKMSPRRKYISLNQRRETRFLRVDYQNLIIHACILMDRTISLSRYFMENNRSISFASFRRHKQSMMERKCHIAGLFPEYTRLIVDETPWFEIPLKVLRDKYLMHTAEKHMLYFGWTKNWELEMITVISLMHKDEELLKKVKAICFNPRRLAIDIQQFLEKYHECIMINKEYMESGGPTT